MKYTARVEQTTYEIDVNEADGKLQVQINGRPVAADWVKLGQGLEYSLLLDHSSYTLVLDQNGSAFQVNVDGETHTVAVHSERDQKLQTGSTDRRERAGHQEIRAPMPGLVVDIEVKAGQSVCRGDGLAIVEAMKMENELTATADGVVREVRVEKGQTVEKDQVLLIIGS